MPNAIRLVKHSDLPALELLFNKEKSIEELNWALQDQNNSKTINGYVAVDENNRIVGFVGYEISNYWYDKISYSAAMPSAWKVADGYKGFAGIQLFKKILDLGDFGMAIKGSEYAQSLYHGFKLKKIIFAYTYFKVISPLKYFYSLKGRPFYKRLGNFAIVIPSFFIKNRIKTTNLKFKQVNRDDINKNVPIVHERFFEKEIGINYLKWLVSCPLHQSYIFQINKNSDFLGYCVCYVQKKYKSSPRGRIVYMPNLGIHKNDWSELLCFLVDFMKKKDCCAVSALASIFPLRKALRTSGFVNYRNKQKPVYIRDTKNVLDKVDICSWYLQYTEGDKTYRNI